MVIGFEFNRIKTEDGKTFYRAAPFIRNANPTRVAAGVVIALAIIILTVVGMTVSAEPQGNSHIKPWSTYNGN